LLSSQGEYVVHQGGRAHGDHADDSTNDDKCHVLFVETSRSRAYGGSKRVLVNLCSAIDRSRYVPHALFYQAGSYVDELKGIGVSVTVVPQDRMSWYGPSEDSASSGNGVISNEESFDRSSNAPRRWFRRAAWHLRSLSRYALLSYHRASVLQQFLPRRVDVIHFNGPLINHYEWWRIARRLRIPIVLRQNQVWRHPPVAYHFVARAASSIVCLTDERAVELTRFAGNKVRVEVIPNGVDTDHFVARRPRHEVRQEFGIEPQARVLVTASHFKPWKGHSLAIQAGTLLMQEGVEFCWILVGKQLDANYVASLRQQLQSKRLESRFLICDEHRDIASILACADLMVHTSTHPDPFPNIVIEAMAVGTPVVVPAEGGAIMVVRHGVDGAVYEPRDAQDLAGHILRLLGSADCLARMRDSCRQRVRENFTLRAQLDRHCEIYARVSNGSYAVS
jgi:glycosyltransferase involved in cell wall biosynthesis